MRKIKQKFILLSVLGVLVIGGVVARIGQPQAVSGEEAAAATATGVTADAPQDAWAVRCNKDTKAEDAKRGRCEVFQRLTHNASQKRLIEFAIGYPPEKKDARGIMILPLGIMLTQGVQLQVDDGKSYSFQIRYCDAKGCYAYLDLDRKLIDSFSNGQKATVTFQSTKPQNIKVEMPLGGFSKALQQVS